MQTDRPSGPRLICPEAEIPALLTNISLEMPASDPPSPNPSISERRERVLQWQAAQPTQGTYLELVEVSDAGFIYECRTTPSLNTFLSPPPSSLKHQSDWIRDYKARELLGLEFYFIIKNKQKSFGTVRLYDFKDESSFTWGSWIVVPGAPLRTAYRSAELVYQLGLDVLHFDHATFSVYNRNTRVIAFHKRMGSISSLQTVSETVFIHHRPGRMAPPKGPSPVA